MRISASMKKGRTRSTREGLLRVREPSNRIGARLPLWVELTSSPCRRRRTAICASLPLRRVCTRSAPRPSRQFRLGTKCYIWPLGGRYATWASRRAWLPRLQLPLAARDPHRDQPSRLWQRQLRGGSRRQGRTPDLAAGRRSRSSRWHGRSRREF